MKAGNSFLLKYSSDLVTLQEVKNLFINLENVYSDNDKDKLPNRFFSICTLEKRINTKNICRSVFTSMVFDEPILKFFRKAPILKFGFRIHGLDPNIELRKWYYESKTPIINFFIDNSNVVIISEMGVAIIDINGVVLWKYMHNELIVESYICNNEIIFLDFSQRKWAMKTENLKGNITEKTS